MLHFPALQTPSCCRLDTEPVHACPSVAAHGYDYQHTCGRESYCGETSLHGAKSDVPAFLAGVASVCPATRAVTTQAMVENCILMKDCCLVGSEGMFSACERLDESNQLELIKNDKLLDD